MGGVQAEVTKPCICQLGVHFGLYRPTGNVNAQGLREFKCRLCGRTEWRQGETTGPKVDRR